MSQLKYKRILLKLSGEILMGDNQFGYEHSAIESLCQDIKAAIDLGVEVCIVVGGGNICRGATLTKIGIERVSADYIGMLATVMNALALQSVLEKIGVNTRVQSAIAMTAVCEPYIRRRAIRHMEKGRVVIFAAGTGYPYVTTDTSSTLRALEMGCDVIVKGTQVDGIYSEDPRKNPDAVKFDKIAYKDVLTKNLQIMDSAAIGLARDNKVPILIFDIHSKGELSKVVKGMGTFTLIE
jgi:uridylate kinase